jgi:5'-phosphate synthase pdxT subunit
MKKLPVVGVLAYHGDVAEHMHVLKLLGHQAMEVLSVADVEVVTHLIIPGGESPVIASFLKKTGVGSAIVQRVHGGTLAVFGTCAGAIILARSLEDAHGVVPLQLIDVSIRRNAYGSQLHSFASELRVQGLRKPVRVAFIRAPTIEAIGKGVEILAREGRKPVLVKSGRVLLCTCHPEIREETAIHELFLTM